MLSLPLLLLGTLLLLVLILPPLFLSALFLLVTLLLLLLLLHALLLLLVLVLRSLSLGPSFLLLLGPSLLCGLPLFGLGLLFWFALLFVLLLLLLLFALLFPPRVGERSGSEKQEQNGCADNASWFHGCCLLSSNCTSTSQ